MENASRALRVLIILLIAIILIWALKVLTQRLVEIAKTRTRAAQLREQQTRTMASLLYSSGTIVIMAVAAVTALPELGFHIGSLLAAAGVAGLLVGFGAQNLIKVVTNGFLIAFENQYAIGDLVQMNGELGRVEHLTLRGTVLRNLHGAMVSIPNSLVGQVANLSRDWSQVFVDVTVPGDEMAGRALATLEKIAGDFRNDADWSAALVEGPRVLGIESLTLEGVVMRLQVRTALGRQDDVARELRRRIKLGFEQARSARRSASRVGLHGEIAPPAQ
jgi:moderate conductance mechanosensitive channel